jgi:hypothetical protein
MLLNMEKTEAPAKDLNPITPPFRNFCVEDDWQKNICQEALLWTSCYRIYEIERVPSSWNMILHWNVIHWQLCLSEALAAPVGRNGGEAPFSETQQCQ